MRRRKPFPLALPVTLAALLSVVMVGTPAAAAPLAGAAPPAAGKPATPPTTAPSAHITLITGDVVSVTPAARAGERPAVEVVKRSGRSHRYHTYAQNRQVYVVPSEATGLLTAGTLDRELFNVTRQVADGYADERRANVPIILSYVKNQPVARAARPSGVVAGSVLGSLNARAATVDKGKAGSFWAGIAAIPAAATAGTATAGTRQATGLRGGLAKVWLDATVRVSLDQSVPFVGAPAAWGRGYQGTGVKVAVLDTGIDTSHPDFAGRIDATMDFTGGGSVADGYGHGTHVASILAGSGAASSGTYKGVAPQARLIVGKVLDDHGRGQMSTVISGMEWAASQGAAVVNLSLGGPPTQGEDPASYAVNQLSAAFGTLFVIAAGNMDFHDPIHYVTSPAAADAALAVGASTKEGNGVSFSRYVRMGDKGVKPEIFAPGLEVRAAQSSQAPDDGDGDPHYMNGSGTSMASPHVAGAAVLLKQQHPSWNNATLKAALVSSAAPVDHRIPGEDVGNLDVDRATRQHVRVNTGTAHVGYFAHPYPAIMTVTRTVTYRNDTASPVTLSLATEAEGDQGTEAPPGVVSVSPATLIVPANGSASATATINAGPANTGRNHARVVATGAGGLWLRSIFEFYKQNHMVDVTVKVLDRNGQPASAWVYLEPYEETMDDNRHPFGFGVQPNENGVVARIPAGKHQIVAEIRTLDASGRYVEETSIVGDPLVNAQHPNFTITLDARNANRLALTAPRTFSPRSLGIVWSRGTPGSWAQSVHQFEYSQYRGHNMKLSVAPTETVTDQPFTVLTGFYGGLPLVTANVTAPSARTLEVVHTTGTHVDGVSNLAAINAGQARPVDLAGLNLTGKIALVRESTALSPPQQVEAVRAAGAAAVLLASAQPGVFWPAFEADAPPLPVLATTKADGDALVTLLAGGAVTVRLEGSPRTPYAYNLVYPHDGSAPANPNYPVNEAQLAQITHRMHGTGLAAGQEQANIRRAGVYGPCGCGVNLNDNIQRRETSRVEYTSAQLDMVIRTALDMVHNMVGERTVYPDVWRSYQPGETIIEDWLRGPLAAGPGNNFTSDIDRSARDGNTIGFAMANGRDSSGHVGALMPEAATMRLYQGSTLLMDSATPWGTATLPSGYAFYRLELDATHAGTFTRLGTRTLSKWTFESGETTSDTLLPLIDVAYVDVVDPVSGGTLVNLANQVAANRAVKLVLRGQHQAGSTADLPTNISRVEVSYNDGATWTDATLAPGSLPDLFNASYPHPVLGSTNGYVSLRVTADDMSGGQFEQTIIRAYRLSA